MRRCKAYENGLDLNAHLPSDIENWKRADIRWEPVPSGTIECKLADGITIVNLGPGHSWGMLGLLAETPAGDNQFFVSDAVYTKKHLGPPEILPTMVHDSDGYFRTTAFIASYASRHNARIIYGHDAEQFASLLSKGRME